MHIDFMCKNETKGRFTIEKNVYHSKYFINPPSISTTQQCRRNYLPQLEFLYEIIYLQKKTLSFNEQLS